MTAFDGERRYTSRGWRIQYPRSGIAVHALGFMPGVLTIILERWCLTGFVILTLETLTRKQAEQWHAHQGLDRRGLVAAIVYSSPWVMPGVRLGSDRQDCCLALVWATLVAGV